MGPRLSTTPDHPRNVRMRLPCRDLGLFWVSYRRFTIGCIRDLVLRVLLRFVGPSVSMERVFGRGVRPAKVVIPED
jgi:hypothetical protein